MRKALVLGEYKIGRFLPVLREHGITDIVVASAVGFDPVVELDGADGADGVAVRPLDPGWDVDDVLAVLDAERPDVAIANPYAHGQEQLPIVYGRAAARWPGRFVAHSATFARVACDKVALHETAVERGWPVPDGRVCADAAQVAAAGEELGYPLVVKEATAQAGSGRHHAADAAALPTVLTPGFSFPAIVQRFVRGTETGVEMISDHAGTLRWPVVSMGPLDGGLDPSLRARITPFALPARAARRLDGFVADIEAHFAPFGPWQIDFAVVEGPDGPDIAVLELNPRLGGLSDLGRVGTGIDPHAVFTAMALGHPLPAVAPRTPAVELPSTERPGVAVPAHPEGAEIVEVTARRPTNRCFITSDRMQLIAPVGDVEAARQWAKELDAAGLLRCPVESVWAQLEVSACAS